MSCSTMLSDWLKNPVQLSQPTRTRAVFTSLSKAIHVLLWFCISILCDWFKKLAPLFQPTKSKTKTNCDLLVFVFPPAWRQHVFTLSFDWFTLSCLGLARVTILALSQHSIENCSKSKTNRDSHAHFSSCFALDTCIYYKFWLYLQVHNPLRLLLTLSCVLLLTCLAARFTCSDHLEDHLAIAALIMAWPYSLTFCRCGVTCRYHVLNNFVVLMLLFFATNLSLVTSLVQRSLETLWKPLLVLETLQKHFRNP